MGRQPEITEVRMTKTDPKNDPNISRTLLIACWGKCSVNSGNSGNSGTSAQSINHQRKH